MTAISSENNYGSCGDGNANRRPLRCPPAWISAAVFPMPFGLAAPSAGSLETSQSSQHHVAPLAMLMAASTHHMKSLPGIILPRGRVSTVLPSSCKSSDPRWGARLAKKTLTVVQVAAATTAGRLMVADWKAQKEHASPPTSHGHAAQQGAGSASEQPTGWGWLQKAAMDATAHIQSRAGGGERKASGAQAKQVAALFNEGLRLEAALDILAARRCYEDALSMDPDNSAVLCRLSKTWTDISYSPGFPSDRVLSANQKALDIAHQAIQLDPDNALGHIAACVSMGRLALCSDNRTKVKLAHDAREEAVLALALDPSNDICHHLMGRWHYEMAGINSMVRLVVRMMYGTALQTGSHEEAAECYRRAIELRPDRLIHQVEYGRCLLKMGMLNEAKAKIKAGLALDLEDINDYTTREDARKLLDKICLQDGTSAANGVPPPPDYSYV